VHLPVSRTGYTGEVGVELQVPAEHAPACWRALVTAGATPCGLGARDTLRLEMGYPLHGNDLDTTVRPAEGRVGWAVQAADAHGGARTFVGSEAVAAAPGTRRLIGLRSDARRPLRAGLDVRSEGRRIGTTTSGGFSPTLGRGIALARVEAAVDPGTVLTVDVRGTDTEVEVVRPPFVDRDPRG
jgi:aminomethyltransferase